MASLRQILGATAADIRRRLTQPPPGQVPGPTTTGYMPAGGSPHNSPPFPYPGGDPYGPPIQKPPGPGGPHYSPPPNRLPPFPEGSPFDVSQDFILAAHQNATNVLMHGRGYQLSGQDHHLTQVSATDTGQLTHTPPPTTSPSHPPNSRPHWEGPPLRITGSGPGPVPGPRAHPPGS